MGVRGLLAAGRARVFAAAARSYVERVEQAAGEGGRRAEAARARCFDVMRQLATADRRHLLFAFAQFFWMCRAAGIDPLELCFDPPLDARSARRLIASAAPADWLTLADEFRDPAGGSFNIFIGRIPDLACFGYVATEMFPELVLTERELPIPNSIEQRAAHFSAALARQIGELQAGAGASEHAVRVMFEVTQALEEVAGADFSLSTLRDNDVLEAWPVVAANGSGLSRYVVYLRYVAALTAEIRAAMQEAASGSARSLDDPDAPDIADTGAGFDSVEGGPEALADRSLLVALLTQSQLARLQLLQVDLRDLSGLHLSRARAATFGKLENDVIQARRDKRDPTARLEQPTEADTHAAMLDELDALTGQLGALACALAHLCWTSGLAIPALRLAIGCGRQTLDEAAAHLKARRSGPPPGLAAMMAEGATAWKSLKRRKSLAELADNPAALGEPDDFALYLPRLIASVERQAGAIRRAVAPCLSPAGFAPEFNRFASALARVQDLPLSPPPSALDKTR